MPSRKTASPSAEPLLTIDEAGQELNLSPRHLRRAIALGELVVHRFGRAVRIARGDLDAYRRAARDD